MFKKYLVPILLIFLLISIVVMGAPTYVNIGPTTDFEGDVGVPSGSNYYINDVQITSDALSDVAYIAMLDENETITGNWVNTDNPWADDEVANDITIDLATLATTFTVTDNESEALDCPLVFVDGPTGAQGAETDGGDLHYNPSTGTLSAPFFAGDGSQLTGVGAAEANALTISAKAAEDIDKGEVVYVSGATGQVPEVSLADNTHTDKHYYCGVAAETKTTGQTILIRVRGELTGLNTDGFVDADELYLSTAGALTKTLPTSGAVELVGYCSYSHLTLGKIVIMHHAAHSIHVPSGNDIIIRMGDALGANKVYFKDYANVEVAFIDSDGKADFTSLTLDTPLLIAEGGTNSGTALNNSRVMVSSGGAIVESVVTTTELERLDGLGGIIVTDVTACTDLEGTGLSISGGVLNWAVPDNSIDSGAYVDGSIDHEHLAVDVITGWAADVLADADTLIFHDADGADLNKITWTNLMGSIIKVDTIATGTWQGTDVGPEHGGTGISNAANNTITFTGNYTLGLTLTANTAITLPTSGIVVSDNSACTDLEGTKLSIAGGVLNCTETDSVVGAVTGIVLSDGGGNISASAVADTFVLYIDGATNIPSGEAGFTYIKGTDTLNVVNIVCTAISGTLTGTASVAASGDAAVDFFGAGVDAVTDATECTDIEGNYLSIAGTTLNVVITGTDTHVIFFDGANTPAGDAGLTYAKTTGSLTAKMHRVYLADESTALNAAWFQITSSVVTGDLTGLRTVMTSDAVSGGDAASGVNVRGVYGQTVVGASGHAGLLQGGLFVADVSAGSCVVYNVHVLTGHYGSGASVVIGGDLYVGYLRAQTRSTDPWTITGHSSLLALENEAVEGNGAVIDSAIRIFDTNVAAAGFTYGIDMSDAVIATADIRLSFGETISNVVDGRVTIGGADLNIDTGKKYMINGTALAVGDITGAASISFYHALGSDHLYLGELDSQPVGETVAFGDILYFDWTTKEWFKAQADAYATARGTRIALEAKDDGETCLMLVKGYIRDDSAFDFGAVPIFLNDDTAGACDDTAPEESGDQIFMVGEAKSADILFFNPGQDVGEI